MRPRARGLHRIRKGRKLAGVCTGLAPLPTWMSPGCAPCSSSRRSSRPAPSRWSTSRWRSSCRSPRRARRRTLSDRDGEMRDLVRPCVEEVGHLPVLPFLEPAHCPFWTKPPDVVVGSPGTATRGVGGRQSHAHSENGKSLLTYWAIAILPRGARVAQPRTVSAWRIGESVGSATAVIATPGSPRPSCRRQRRSRLAARPRRPLPPARHPLS
jgi:hypothetical protein